MKPLPRPVHVGDQDKLVKRHAAIFIDEIKKHCQEYVDQELTPPELIQRISYEGSIYSRRVGRQWEEFFMDSTEEEEEEDEEELSSESYDSMMNYA